MRPRLGRDGQRLRELVPGCATALVWVMVVTPAGARPPLPAEVIAFAEAVIADPLVAGAGVDVGHVDTVVEDGLGGLMVELSGRGPGEHGRGWAMVSDTALEHSTGFVLPSPRKVPNVRLPLRQLHANAEQFARAWLPESYRSPRYGLVEAAREQRVGPGGYLSFGWTVAVNGLQLPSGLNVLVRVWDGRICGAGVTVGTMAVAAEPAFGEATAIAAAQRELLARGLTGWRHAGGDRLVYRAEDGRQVHGYVLYFARVDAAAPAPWETVPLLQVEIDALDGSTVAFRALDVGAARLAGILHHHGWLPEREDLATDEEPCWLAGPLSGQLAMVSSRSRPGHPRWLSFTRNVYLVEPATGSVSCLLQDGEDDYSGIAAGGSWLACDRGGGETVLLSLVDGSLRPVTTSRRPGSRPALSADGRRLAFVAERSGRDLDVFVVDTGGHSLAEQRRVARLEGEEEYPVFSPDGRWVYFAHQPAGPAAEGAGFEVWRVRPDYAYQENDPPQRIAGGFDLIERLSVFPDNRRLLVWHGGQLEVLDGETGARELLRCPELRNPDDAAAPPLKMRSPCLSPDGHQLAFVAFAAGAQPLAPVGTYLYTCDLDFTNLRRVTPNADVVVPPFRWLGTGQRAFEVLPEDEPLLGLAVRWPAGGPGG